MKTRVAIITTYNPGAILVDGGVVVAALLAGGCFWGVEELLRKPEILDKHTDPWGIKVSAVEVKHVDLPENMQRAMARQAEAEREKRAKIIHAEGEFQASTQLSQAAGVIASEPMTITLRYLQTLTEIAAEKNSTIIFPLPIELLHLLKLKEAKESGA